MMPYSKVLKIAVFCIVFAIVVTAFSHQRHLSILHDGFTELSAPNIADDASGLVFIGREPGASSAIYYSSLTLRMDKPPVVASEGMQVSHEQGLITHFFSSQHSGYSTGYNAPMLENNLITFGAVLHTNTPGLFYVVKEKENFQTLPLVLTNQKQFTKVDAPYISNGIIYFLAEDQFAKQTIYRFHPKANKPFESLLSTDNELKDLWNMSVQDSQIAFRATDSYQNQAIYLWQEAKQPIKLSPNYASTTNNEHFSLGGPSLFAGKVAYTVFYYTTKNDETKLQRTGIYTNALGRNLHDAIVQTGDYINKEQGYFIKMSNPTLYITANKKNAYIAFQAFTEKFATQSSVHVAKVSKESVSIISIITPGQKINGKTVKEATLGAVSLRNMIMPVKVVFADKTQAIVLVKIE